tara:strand:+ start:122 stop:379 length:258 start_codon:yes stop_codon:yes gene_type:complete
MARTKKGRMGCGPCFIGFGAKSVRGDRAAMRAGDALVLAELAGRVGAVLRRCFVCILAVLAEEFAAVFLAGKGGTCCAQDTGSDH